MQIELVKYDDPILRTHCSPVRYPEDFQDHVHEMFGILEKWNALGLAAPQIGLNKRFFVTKHAAHFNPEVRKQSLEYAIEDEECLSMPGIVVPVPRPMWIEIGYRDECGERHDQTLWHLSARVFLHELDHLNGKLITDYK